MERCPTCNIKMKPLTYDGEQFHRCPKCKWYHGCFYSAPTHPRNETPFTVILHVDNDKLEQALKSSAPLSDDIQQLMKECRKQRKSKRQQ